MSINIRCPSATCGKTIGVPDNSGGKRVQCPVCKCVFLVPVVAGDQTARPSALRPPSPSRFAITHCPGCGAIPAVGADACPDCGYVLHAEPGSSEPQKPPRLCANAHCGTANAPDDRRCARCSSFTIGAFIKDRYRIDKHLKSGGFGAVYRGADSAHGEQPVVIKDMIIDDPKNLSIYLKFFHREAEILRALQSIPAVPRFYDFMPQPQAAHLVMEFIPGKTLDETLAQNGFQPFPVELVIEWGLTICDLLETMHSQSPPLVHRDLKPDNIMLLPDQRTIKLIDFGAARELDFDEAKSRSTTLGTDGYAPPEQFQGKPQTRSDLYALAATLYRLATGKEPEAFNAGKAIRDLLNDPHSFLRPDDRWFFELLRINVSLQPNERYPSAQEFKASLIARSITYRPASVPEELDLSLDPGLVDEPSSHDTDSRVRAGADTVEETPVYAVEPIDDIATVYPPIKKKTTFVEPPPDPLADLRAACQLAPPDWWTICALAEEVRQAGHILPAELRQLASEAKSRNECFMNLSSALAAGKLQKIVDAYDSTFLDDWPAVADQVAQARQAVASLAKLNELRELTKTSHAGKTLIQRWLDYGPQLSPWAEAEPIRNVVRSWEERNLAYDNLRRLTIAKKPSERAIVDASAELQRLGGHPDAAALQERIKQAAARAACLERLPAESASESEAEDNRMLQAWNEDVLQDCPEAERHRPRLNEAKRRHELLAKLGEAIAASNRSYPGERNIVKRAESLPGRYVHQHAKRVAAAEVRVRAGQALAKALAARPVSDKALARAWSEAQKAGLHVEARIAARCQLAEKRRQCLQRLEKIIPALPVDKQDQEWLKLWDAKLLVDCADAEPLRPAHAKAFARAKAWRDLESAIKAKDFEHVAELAANPLLANYPPMTSVEAEVRDLTKQASSLRLLKVLLQKNEVDAFIAQVDFDHLRSHGELYAPFRQAIESLVARWLHERQPIGKSVPESSVDRQSGLVRVRWTWRFFGVISYCRVAVSPDRNFDTLADAGGQTMQIDAEAHRGAGGGIEVAPLPGRRRLFVTVWPVIDLRPTDPDANEHGWNELVGSPLKLGPIRVEP